MSKIQILARFGDGDEVGCGWRECRTALEAVMLEIDGRCPDTVDADEIGAVDDQMAVSAHRVDLGRFEVHIYVDHSDAWFEYEV